VLPEAYGTPAAIALVLGGALTCFAGYRLFRVVLGIYGFVLGAMIASSTVGVNSTGAMVAAALIGGLVGAVVLMLAYFVGIALVGAGLGALLANVAWGQVAARDPPALAVILVSVAGAFIAMWLQRYVIVVGTAFGGGWTVIVGAVNLFAARGVARGGSASEVWILYPTSIGDQRWAPVAWVLLGLAGTAVQLALTGRKK
jgi:hypothetical protein